MACKMARLHNTPLGKECMRMIRYQRHNLKDNIDRRCCRVSRSRFDTPDSYTTLSPCYTEMHIQDCM